MDQRNKGGNSLSKYGYHKVKLLCVIRYDDSPIDFRSWIVWFRFEDLFWRNEVRCISKIWMPCLWMFMLYMDLDLNVLYEYTSINLNSTFNNLSTSLYLDILQQKNKNRKLKKKHRYGVKQILNLNTLPPHRSKNKLF